MHLRWRFRVSFSEEHWGWWPVLLRRSWLEDSSALKKKLPMLHSWEILGQCSFLWDFPSLNSIIKYEYMDKYEFRFVCGSYNPPKQWSKIVARKFATQKVNWDSLAEIRFVLARKLSNTKAWNWLPVQKRFQKSGEHHFQDPYLLLVGLAPTNSIESSRFCSGKCAKNPTSKQESDCIALQFNIPCCIFGSQFGAKTRQWRRVWRDESRKIRRNLNDDKRIP